MMIFPRTDVLLEQKHRESLVLIIGWNRAIWGRNLVMVIKGTYSFHKLFLGSILLIDYCWFESIGHIRKQPPIVDAITNVRKCIFHFDAKGSLEWITCIMPDCSAHCLH